MNKVIVKPPCSKKMMDLTLEIAKNQTSKIRHCKRYYHMINTNHLEKHYAPELDKCRKYQKKVQRIVNTRKRLIKKVEDWSKDGMKQGKHQIKCKGGRTKKRLLKKKTLRRR